MNRSRTPAELAEIAQRYYAEDYVQRNADGLVRDFRPVFEALLFALAYDVAHPLAPEDRLCIQRKGLK